MTIPVLDEVRGIHEDSTQDSIPVQGHVQRRREQGKEYVLCAHRNRTRSLDSCSDCLDYQSLTNQMKLLFTIETRWAGMKDLHNNL